MFEFSFSKILLTALVMLAVWRGYRIYQQLQGRLAAAQANQRAATHSRPGSGHRSRRVPALRAVRAQWHDLPQRRASASSAAAEPGGSP